MAIPDLTASPLERFRRDPEAPPSDSLAEAMVLGALLNEPTLIGSVELAPLLHFREHRAMWFAMLSLPAPLRSDNAGFFFGWSKALCEQHCADRAEHEFWTVQCNAFLMWTSVTEARRAEDEWIEEQYERTRLDDPRRYVHYHDWQWWLARLKRCAEARRIVAAAQEIASKAWQAPDVDYQLADAQAALARVHSLARSRFTLEIPR